MGAFNLKTFATADELAQEVALNWLNLIQAAQERNEPYLVALSGGRSAKLIFSAAAALAKSRAVSWQNVHFFWADERCVPPDDAESNFLLAQQALFQPLQIPASQIHRLEGELEPKLAVENANKEIARFISSEKLALDLVLLGLGEDGHVASLFPNATAETLESKSSFLFVDNSPKPPPKRISLSYESITNAKEVWVVANGEGKRNALHESIRENGTTPLAKVIQRREKTRIFA